LSVICYIISDNAIRQLSCSKKCGDRPAHYAAPATKKGRSLTSLNTCVSAGVAAALVHAATASRARVERIVS
jgi:hypothetical protein